MFALCQISKKYQEQALNFFSFLIQMSEKQNTEKLLKTKVLNLESETFQKGFSFSFDQNEWNVFRNLISFKFSQ